jgi:putative hydrolase of HD superfamily
MSEIKRIVDFFFELGQLASTPRRGFALLGTGPQNVAEHSYRTALIGFVLARCQPETNPWRVAWMCLIHDLPETRITDLDPLAKRYVQVDADRALAEQILGLPGESDFAQAWREYSTADSVEAVLAHDADLLELLLTLREQESRGQIRASDWLERTVDRLQSPAAKALAEGIIGGDPSHWWESISLPPSAHRSPPPAEGNEAW